MFTRRTGSLCLLSAIMATTVYAYTDYSDVRYVLGGANGTDPGCKAPCANGETTVTECLDPCAFFGAADCVAADQIGNGGKCNKRYCTINTLRYYSCAVGIPASGNECKWIDAVGAGNTWQRKHQIYEQACTTANVGPNDDAEAWTCKKRGNIPAVNGGNGWTTPCLATSGCGTGTLRDTNDSSAAYLGRRICN